MSTPNTQSLNIELQGKDKVFKTQFKMVYEQGKIAVIKQLLGYPYVNEHTTNPDLFPQSNQLKLF